MYLYVYTYIMEYVKYSYYSTRFEDHFPERNSIMLTSVKSTNSMRAAQIGLGAIAIILSTLILIHPAASVVSITLILSAILLVVGIERVLSGILVDNNSRWGSIGLGVLVIILASIFLSYPVGTTVFLLLLIAVALLFVGIAGIIRGIGDKQGSGWSRVFGVVAGVIAVAVSGLIMASPLYGAVFASLVLGIALLVIGIQIIAAGVSGRKMRMMATKGVSR
jgi:uncharacterized membrane protein HdeD (DUF308 family)